MSTVASLPYGPLMIDLAGKAMTPEEGQRLVHPLVGGVILFTRNYESPQQLTALCAEIHALRKPAAGRAGGNDSGRDQAAGNASRAD